MESNFPAISGENLKVGIGGKTLIEPFTFEIKLGEIVGFEGANGTGKSVLLKTLCGFVLPQSGVVHFHPSLKTKSRFNPNLGVCIDGPGFDPDATGLQNLSRLAKVRKRVSKSEISRLMHEFGLDAHSRIPMREYSLGMKQKIDLIQAIMEGQQVLLLDEPFNGLDATSRNLLREKLVEFKNQGKAIVITSHSTEDWADLADRRWLLENNQLSQK